jgi:ABC-type uncharacterized transport system substrate-binding protein
VLTVRWPGPETGSFENVASEFVKERVDVLVVTAEGNMSIAAVKRAAETIPIVMATSAYPVERGLVASLARPAEILRARRHLRTR